MNDATIDKSAVGFVAIGRNEGERLKSALRAIQRLCPASGAVYVDSGSSDESVNFARAIGIDVVALDMSVPFTAARARNAGFQRLIDTHPDIKFVQFLDGDCELLEGWIETALDALQADETTGIVSGRRLEKYPQASVYNTLMDIEWNTPVGETLAVPGDMCVKVEVFTKINGFSENIIAAEDDDLCLRARRAGYKVFRLDANMSRHDANIMHLSQWYRRSKRGGHGYANIYHIHGNGPEKYFRRELISVFTWGGLVPLAFFSTLFVLPTLAVLILAFYSAFVFRTIVRRQRQGDQPKVAVAYGFLIFTGKVPELFGIVEYWKNHLLSRKHQLIEYK